MVLIAKWNAGEKPIDPSEVKNFSLALAHRGSKGARHWVGKGVLIVSHHSTDDGEEFFAWTSDSGHDLVVALDGCVDNRAELAAELNVRGSMGAAELVARAYDAWHEGALTRLLGAVSLVVWDGRRRRLLSVHDVVGEKPVYYHHAPDQSLVCASEICGVLADVDVPRRVNDAFVAEYLLYDFSTLTDSIYESVQRLLPSHFLSVSDRDFKIRRYFEFDLGCCIRNASDREYAEQFQHLFDDVLQSQTQQDVPFAAELSGGIDSSYLAGAIGRLINASKLPGPLTTVSQVFPGMQCDESAFIRDVAEMWNARSLLVNPNEHTVFDFSDQVSRHQYLPYTGHYATAVASHSLCRSEGIHSILTGFGSDELFHGGTGHWHDVIRSGKWWQLLDTRTSYGQPENRALAKTFAKSLLPSGFVNRIQQRKRQSLFRNDLPYFRSDMFQKIRLEERFAMKESDIGSSRYFAQRSILTTLSAPWFLDVLALLERMASYCGVQLRHPFLDRRVIEFALAIPESQRWRQDKRKFVIREAGHGTIPKSVLSRETKTTFPDLQYQAILSVLRDGAPVFPALSSRGWIREEKLAADIAHMKDLYDRKDDGYSELAWPLWRVIAVEMFLAHVD